MNVLKNGTVLLNQSDFTFEDGAEMTDDTWSLNQNPNLYVQHAPYCQDAPYIVWEQKDDVFIEHGFFRFQGQAFAKVAELLKVAA